MTRPARPLKIGILGTRGIPANYGGFETFAEELSTRLARRGHAVAVYGRWHYVGKGLKEYRGVAIKRLPAIRQKYLDTVSHTALSVIAALFQRFDVILVCNAANAIFAWVPRLAGTGVALNVDGIERKRGKWGAPGRLFYRFSERLATLLPLRLVSDAEAIRDYYLQKYGCESTFIPYGASLKRADTTGKLRELGVEPGGYLLYVSRLEPENNAHIVLKAYRQSEIQAPLVMVGDAPYSRRYIRKLKERAEGANAILPGAIYGRGYRELISHCLCYLQATEVGGTHPALIEAMGVGALVIANDTPENREVVGGAGLLAPFREESGKLAALLREVADDPGAYARLKEKARERVRRVYDWESVVDRYEELFHRLAGVEPAKGSGEEC